MSLQQHFKKMASYLWLIFHVCVILSSLEGLALAEKIGQLFYTNSQSYDSSHSILQGHLEFRYGGHIMDAEFGRLGMGASLKENTLGNSNNESSSSEHSSKYLNLGWRGYQGASLKKAKDIITSSESKSLSQLNNENNFSQYIKVGWHYSWDAPLGQTFTFFASTRGELYQNQIFKRSLSEANRRGETNLFPQTGVDWSGPSVPVWPGNIVFQLLGKLIVAPRQAIGSVGRPTLDEGSFNFGIHDVPHDNDRLGADQFSGNPGTHTGSHTFYGGKILTTSKFLGKITLFLGQNYALSQSNHQHNSEGLSSRFSNYVGYIKANPWSWLMLEYRFSFDRKSLKHSISKVGGSIGYPIASLSGNYVVTRNFFGINNENHFNKSNQSFNLFLFSQITNSWSFMSSVMQDLQKKQKKSGGGQYGVGVHYNDKNFTAGFTINRQFYPHMGLKPAITYMLIFGFNTAGEYIFPSHLTAGEQNTSRHLSLRP